MARLQIAALPTGEPAESGHIVAWGSAPGQPLVPFVLVLDAVTPEQAETLRGLQPAEVIPGCVGMLVFHFPVEVL